MIVERCAGLRWRAVRRMICGGVLLLWTGAALAQATGPAGGTAASRAVTVTPNVSLGQQNPFLGAVPSGKATGEVIPLSLQEALQRGLKYNLGLVLSEQGTAAARAARLRSLSDLLPNINARVTEVVEQTNLAALGLPAALLPPGVSPIVGPFSVFDSRVTARVPLLDVQRLRNFRASNENVRAAQYTYDDAKDLVVLVVGGTYMQAVSGASLIQSVQAQVNTAQRLFQSAQDQKNAGVAAGIDVLRAQVELQAQQQRLVVARNEYEKQKLTLARAIGLPLGQQFTLTDAMPYAPLPPLVLDQALERAYRSRSDFRSLQAQVRAAELTRDAAAAEHYPNLAVNGDYGVIGRTPGNSHGTFTAAASLNVPVFQGGRIRGEIAQAESVLAQRRAQVEDQRSRIEFEVRSAFLDLQAAADQVQVARSSVDLAQQTLTQAQDRFAAGVTNNIEVVQAQEAVAAADENYILSLFAHNLAKLSLARALGVAQEASKEFLGGER